MADALTAEVILRLYFLQDHNCLINFGKRLLNFVDRGTSVALQQNSDVESDELPDHPTPICVINAVTDEDHNSSFQGLPLSKLRQL